MDSPTLLLPDHMNPLISALPKLLKEANDIRHT